VNDGRLNSKRLSYNRINAADARICSLINVCTRLYTRDIIATERKGLEERIDGICISVLVSTRVNFPGTRMEARKGKNTDSCGKCDDNIVFVNTIWRNTLSTSPVTLNNRGSFETSGSSVVARSCGKLRSSDRVSQKISPGG
jgi:hypothetical protein